jgi:hypothetical protein
MTCKKNGVGPYQAILSAFEGKTPDFIKNWTAPEGKIAG